MKDNAEPIPGDVAWIVLASSVILYDTAAVLSGKAETMSSAIWRSLEHPYKFPIAALMWAGLSWHFFVNPRARSSYKMHHPRIKQLTKRKVTK